MWVHNSIPSCTCKKGECKVAFKEFLLYNFFERPHTVKLTFRVLLKTEVTLISVS